MGGGRGGRGGRRFPGRVSCGSVTGRRNVRRRGRPKRLGGAYGGGRERGKVGGGVFGLRGSGEVGLAMSGGGGKAAGVP